MVAGIRIEGGIEVGGSIAIGPDVRVPLPPTLVLSLDAGNPSSYSGSGSTWTDLIGGKTFTLNGSPTYSSNNGGYLNFDPASSQWANSSTSLSNLNTWTVEVWHYYTGDNDGVDGGSGASIVTELFPGTTSNINFSIGNDAALGSPTDLQAGFFDGAWRATPTGYSLTANNWYQIVGTYDGSTIKLYVNNVLVNSTSYSGTPISSGGGIRLMRRWDNADYWGGRLSIIKIYEGSLSQSGVTSSWNTSKARFGL